MYQILQWFDQNFTWKITSQVEILFQRKTDCQWPMCGLSRWGGGYPGPLPWWPLPGGYPGPLPWWPLLWGGGGWGGTLVHFHDDHFWGGTLVNFHDDHFQGGILVHFHDDHFREVGVPWSTSMMTTSGGVPWSTSMMTTSVMTTSMMTTSGGTLVHFHDHFHDNFHYHFWGSHVTYPTMQFMLSLISRHQNDGSGYSVTPKDCGKVTWDHPQSWTDWQTNMSERFTFPHTTYAVGKNILKFTNYLVRVLHFIVYEVWVTALHHGYYYNMLNWTLGARGKFRLAADAAVLSSILAWRHIETATR